MNKTKTKLILLRNQNWCHLCQKNAQNVNKLISCHPLYAAAKSTFGGGWVLTGFEKMDNDGNQVKYSDTGIETNIRPWYQHDITGNNKPYLSVNVANSKWLSRPWGFKAYSVCEKVTLSVSSTTSPTPESKFFSG